MYTLRTFKDKGGINRLQISLGYSYQVKGACEKDKEIGIKLRIHGEANNVPQDGLAIYEEDYAFIMTESGKTFEKLNIPKKCQRED